MVYQMIMQTAQVVVEINKRWIQAEISDRRGEQKIVHRLAKERISKDQSQDKSKYQKNFAMNTKLSRDSLPTATCQ